MKENRLREILKQIVKAPHNIWRELKLGFSKIANNSISSKWRKIIFRTILVTLAAIAAVLVIAGVGIYAFKWQNTFSYTIAKVIPFPSGYVNGSELKYADYMRSVNTTTTYFKQLKKSNSKTTAQPNGKDVNKQAFSDQISNALIARYAKQHKITVSKAELNKNLDSIYKSQGGEKKALAVIKKNLGMNKSDYVAQIKQQILRNKVAQAITKDPDLTDQSRDQANKALAEAQKNSNFAQVAAKYSQDISATRTGTRASIPARSLPKAAADAISSVQDGQLVDRVININGTYYILKREKTIGQEIFANTIIIRPLSIFQWLADQTAKAKIIRLLAQTK